MSLQGKALRRFYEPLVLFQALSQSCLNAPSGASRYTEPSENPLTNENVFQRLVYKLAYVCASEKGGNSVTSVAVMENEESMVYLFACNQIEESKGKRIAEHIKALLSRVSRSAQTGRDSEAKSSKAVFTQILLFNRSRIEGYLKRIVDHAKNCLSKSQRDILKEPRVLARLRGLANCSSNDLKGEPVESYIESCLSCFRELNTRVPIHEFLRRQALQAEMTSGEEDCWSELLHCISRMRAYEQAVGVLFEARRDWPELFENVEVYHIRSSTPDPNPLKKKSFDAKAILGRMSANQTITDRFHTFASDMGKFDLNERIERQCTKNSFKPIVHAELLVHDWIMHESRDRGLRFFNGWRYIGSSKPTCRLCRYYVEAAQSDIEVRASHGNLYLNWKFPEGHAKEAGWQKMFNRMVERIRNDAFKILADKSSIGKKHDSNTYYTGWSARNSQAPGSGDESEEDVDSIIAELGDKMSTRLTLETIEEGDGDSDGGAKL